MGATFLMKGSKLEREPAGSEPCFFRPLSSERGAQHTWCELTVCFRRTGAALRSGRDGAGLGCDRRRPGGTAPVGRRRGCALRAFLLLCCLPDAGRTAPARLGGDSDRGAPAYVAAPARPGRALAPSGGAALAASIGVLLIWPRHVRRRLKLRRGQEHRLADWRMGAGRIGNHAPRQGDSSVRPGAVADPVKGRPDRVGSAQRVRTPGGPPDGSRTSRHARRRRPHRERRRGPAEPDPKSIDSSVDDLQVGVGAGPNFRPEPTSSFSWPRSTRSATSPKDLALNLAPQSTSAESRRISPSKFRFRRHTTQRSS